MKHHFELVFRQLLIDLKKNGMSKNRISKYRRLTNRFLRDYSNGLITNYDGFICRLQESTLSHMSLWHVIAMVKSIQDYDQYGKLPRIVNKSKYNLLPTYFQDIVDNAVSYAREDGKADRSLLNLHEEGAAFLYHLHIIGIKRIEDADLNAVESYFYSNGEIKRGYRVQKGLKWFLKHCLESTGDCVYQKIYSFIPDIVNVRKVYPSLTDCESNKIESVILDESNRLSWFDRAIGAISFYTGMRSCDIANLKSENIDWKNKKIHFVQCKTQREVSLILDPVIGNPIYKYIVEERPKIKSPFIFVCKISHKPIDRHVTYKSIVNIFFEAGVRIMNGRRGTHLLRHRLATSMVQNDTDISIVSSALGHAVTNSVNAYLESDVKHLQRCSISIEGLMPELPSQTCDKDIINKLCRFISLNPKDVLPDDNNKEQKELGLSVSKAPLALSQNDYYKILKNLSIDNKFLKKINYGKINN